MYVTLLDAAAPGVTDAQRVPTTPAVLRAAIGSSAVVVPWAAVPGALPAAAVLRHPDESTSS